MRSLINGVVARLASLTLRVVGWLPTTMMAVAAIVMFATGVPEVHLASARKSRG